MEKYRVMIVDDQSISRHLFEMYVNNSPKYELVFSLSSASAADVYILRHEVDLILMDILMNDGSNGLEAAEKIKKLRSDIKIIAVTSMPEYSWLEKAKSIGIESFWYKEADEQTILEVMDRTMAGESVYPDSSPRVKLGLADSSELTERELEILRIVTTGATNQQVAEQLGISENTVKSHVRSMLDKTGFRSRTELAIKARVLGIAISSDDV
ncbi:response regulator transcription factor [Ruminococcus albus]|jgi:two-component system vancomycin resistance associated response regulator VraR|uniref:Stage 0 sporulation protein A homolog n=1 Tax=Ruminococcus albus SY3 TaxID=1341156 RepID=A0A011VUF2_RUMAL|nr:response regulator transcription factor [Ruminococcus albus]EXM38258.1 LuxR family transcriptional regulator [Ruminococcus albus SY3]EXM39792.1 LuxR family transcriptional regulator [Ruminococcus albus SY3]MBE6868856.1 response regulator transcription factor [Ruminococcus albus]MBP5269260.1 response regulator transcription factor [Ruminococcus sp.]